MTPGSNTDLTNPLSDILRRAQQRPVRDFGFGKVKERMGKSKPGMQVIVADVSSSMSAIVHDTRTRIALLRAALKDTVTYAPHSKIVAFNYDARVVSPTAHLDPSGGTALHKGLDKAAEFKPERTVVITDGEPDSQVAALEAAEKMSGIIDCIYCGPEGNDGAIDF